MENAEQIKKEMQESISKRLKALPPKSQSKASSQPEPEPEHEEEEVEEAQPEESTGWEIAFQSTPSVLVQIHLARRTWYASHDCTHDCRI